MVHHVVTAFTCLPWLGSGTDRAVSWMGTERKGVWSGGQLILYLSINMNSAFWWIFQLIFFVLIHFGSLDKINPRSEILAIDRHCCWPLDFWYSICCIDQSLWFWGKLSAAVGQRHFGVHHAWGMWKILTREIICPTCCHSAQEGLFSTFQEVYVYMCIHTLTDPQPWWFYARSASRTDNTSWDFVWSSKADPVMKFQTFFFLHICVFPYQLVGMYVYACLCPNNHFTTVTLTPLSITMTHTHEIKLFVI